MKTLTLPTKHRSRLGWDITTASPTDPEIRNIVFRATYMQSNPDGSQQKVSLCVPVSLSLEQWQAFIRDEAKAIGLRALETGEA
jgi:hypothetical protein